PLSTCGLSYCHFGSPSLVAGVFDFFPMMLAPPLFTLFPYTTLFRSSLVVTRPDSVFPVVSQYVAEPGVDVQAVVPVYLIESAKRSEEHTSELQSRGYIVSRFAFAFVFANFGIAIAARIPMITTTINS